MQRRKEKMTTNISQEDRITSVAQTSSRETLRYVHFVLYKSLCWQEGQLCTLLCVHIFYFGTLLVCICTSMHDCTIRIGSVHVHVF